MFQTPFGPVALGIDLDDAPFTRPTERCGVLLICGRWSAAPTGEIQNSCRRVKRRMEALARGVGAVACVAGAVGADVSRSGSRFVGGSGLYARDGGCVVAAKPGIEEIVVGEIAPTTMSSIR